MCAWEWFAAQAHRRIAARQELAQAILATNEAQAQLLGKLSDSGSAVARDVLSAWSREGVYLYITPDGTKVPVLLEDQQDSDGKARARRISDGQVVKDDKGAELRFGPDDLNTADTDMPLRKLIQQTLDAVDSFRSRCRTPADRPS